jgi:transcriptional regulator with XRE-family HTH domain
MTEGESKVRTQLRDVGSYIRDHRRRAQLSLRKLSELAGVSNPYLSQIERGVRQPSAKILQGIAKALRVSAESLYAQAGILEDATGDPDVLRAIFQDQGLTDGQRRTLAETYERFRIETSERRARTKERRLHAAGGEEG